MWKLCVLSQNLSIDLYNKDIILTATPKKRNAKQTQWKWLVERIVLEWRTNGNTFLVKFRVSKWKFCQSDSLINPNSIYNDKNQLLCIRNWLLIHFKLYWIWQCSNFFDCCLALNLDTSLFVLLQIQSMTKSSPFIQ